MVNTPCFVLAIVIVNAFLIGVKTQLQCRDEQNKPVDWFVLYKIPKLSETSNPLIRRGEAYLYVTSDTVSNGWKISGKSIGSKTSIPGYTLAPLYINNASMLWTLYNDKAPNKTAEGNYGHTKGSVMADSQQGFWLIHSVPGFPGSPEHGTDPPARSGSERAGKLVSLTDEEYSYPKTGKLYGQSFLCISVEKDQLDLIGMQLRYNQIIPYRNNLPNMLAEKYPNLAKAANKIRIKDAPFNHKTFIKSSAGVEFLSFAKSDKWDKDLYDEFVAPQLGADLLTETWLNGGGKLPSDCNASKVINVRSINLDTVNVVFESSHDHSKWAVASSGNKNRNWICIGDINRAVGQLRRGGGTVCLNSQKLWNSYRHIVNDVEPCPKRRPRLANWMTNLV